MKKALSLVLSAIMLLACLTSLTMFASAEGEVIATMTPSDLVSGVPVNVTAKVETDEDGTEFARFTATAGDPYMWYNHMASIAGKSQFMKITYRTSTECTKGEFFCHTATYGCAGFSYVNDGEWHSIIIDLTANSEYSDHMDQFRIDPLTGEYDATGVIDYKSVEFFNAKDLEEGEYTLNLTTDPFAQGICSVDIGSDVVLSGSLVMPDGAWTSVHYSINGSIWYPATYEAGENGAFENLVIPTNTLAGGIHTVSVQFRNDFYQSVTLSATVHVDLSTVLVGEGTTNVLFENGTGARPFGVHIDAMDGLCSFTILSLATYGGSTDKMKVEAFAWNTDIETTLAGNAVWTKELSGLSDNVDYTIEFPAGAVKGDVYLQFTPIDGSITPKSADTSVNSAIEFYIDGAKVETGFMGFFAAANPTTMIWDLTTGSEDIAFLPTQDASVIKVAPGYVKAIATADGAAITNVGVNLNPGFKYVGILYRTNTADATVTVNGSEPVALTTDGLWNIAYVDLANTDLETVADLAIGIVGQIDIAYVGIYKSASLRAASANDAVAATLNRVTREETVYDAEKDALIDIGIMHSMAPTFVYDYSLWIEDAAAAYGFANPHNVAIAENKLTAGYVTFDISGDDPYFAFATNPEGYANQLGYVVVKYRTTSSAQGEFFTATSGGYNWADPMDNTHIAFDYNSDGNWHTTVVNVSSIWGGLYGQTLQNFRFDPIVGSSGSIDISYIAFYSNLAAAEAAAAADEGKEPAAPVDPSTVTGVVFDGESIFTNLGVTGCSGKYNYDGGYMTLTSQSGDPNYYLFHNDPKDLGPILAIKYRTTAALDHDKFSEVFIGNGTGASGNGDTCSWANPVINDGDWHIAYCDISKLSKIPAVNDDGTYTVNYFRVDFLRDYGDLDVAYIGFFKTVDDLIAYDAQIWTAPKYYKVTFVADEVEVSTVYYREGTNFVSSPGVPAKEGFTGQWEEITFGQDIVVNAIYTEIPEDTEPEDTEPETPTQPDSETSTEGTTEPAENQTTADAGDKNTSADNKTEPGTNNSTKPEEEQGCKSVMTIGTCVALVSMLALGVVYFKKKD